MNKDLLAKLQEDEEAMDVLADQEAVGIHEANQEATSPYMKPKAELVEDKVEREPTLEQKYRAIMESYNKEANKAIEKPQVMDALPDILSGLYNVGVRAKGGVLPELKIPSGIKAQQARQNQAKQQKLTGLDNTRKMLKDLMELQNKNQMTPYQKEQVKIEKAKLDTKNKEKSVKSSKPTKLEEERQKNIADRYDSLQEQMPNAEANIKEAEELITLIKDDQLDTGPGSKLAGDIGSFFGTKESEYKQRLDSLAEKAARAMLKANGEVRPTDADVEGMKRALFNMGNTESANIKKLEDFILQQQAVKDEYGQMREVLKRGEGLEDFILKPVNSEVKKQKSPYGNEVERNGKKYRWNPNVRKYQLIEG